MWFVRNRSGVSTQCVLFLHVDELAHMIQVDMAKESVTRRENVESRHSYLTG